MAQQKQRHFHSSDLLKSGGLPIERFRKWGSLVPKDVQYYKNLLMSVECTFTEELEEHERNWQELDDFLRSEYLAVNVVDAWRYLGKLQDAEKAGELPEELLQDLRRVERYAQKAKPRTGQLKLSTEE